MSLLKASFRNLRLKISFKDVGIYMCLFWHSFGKSESHKTEGCLDKMKTGETQRDT